MITLAVEREIEREERNETTMLHAEVFGIVFLHFLPVSLSSMIKVMVLLLL